MKLYNSNLAPSPRRVRIFLAEKGVSIPRVEVDLGKLEHKSAGILGAQSLPDYSDPRTRRRDEDRRDRSRSAAISRRFGRSRTCSA